MLAGSLYLISTAAFSLISLLIGIRLIGLSRRTGETPEFSLGWGLILTAGLGYGLMITALVLRETAADPASAGLAALTMLGKMLHNLGVMAILCFVVMVFRPGVRWARRLAGAMSAVLWTGFVGVCLTGGLETGMPGGFWYWTEFSVIGTYAGWAAIEALRYYGIMKKRQELGLADPLLVNRFLLWGLASIASLAAIWTVALPGLLGMNDTATNSTFVSGCLILTSFFGTACVSTYWITFFPPRWYATWLGAEASG